jgi:CHAD domain-containing protein
MAKPKEIEGLDCGAPASGAAALVLRERFDEMMEFRAPALDFSDIEGVHDMRVAARRLRSALRDFAPLFTEDSFSGVRAAIKDVADALGEVRDRDVEIEALKRFRERAENDGVKKGIEKLIRARRAERGRARQELKKILSARAAADLRKAFAAAAGEAVEREIPGKDFSQFGRETVRARLEEFCERSASLYSPFRTKRLHKLRIYAKRLRYAIQLYEPCLDKKAQSFAKEIARMQDFLGGVHDADERIESLGAAFPETPKSARETAFWLLGEFVRERHENYLGALELWREWQARDFAGKLRKLIF